MLSDYPASFAAVFESLHISPKLIGKGGEGYVFAFGNEQVLKVYPKTNRTYLESLKKLQEQISQGQLPYATPLIEQIGEVNGTYYTIEKRLEGKNLETIFSTLSSTDQELVLEKYLAALKPLRGIPIDYSHFGQLLDTPDSLHSDSWGKFLLSKLHQKLLPTKERLTQDVPSLSRKITTLEAMIQKWLAINPEKKLVHGDYYLNNVLVNEEHEITSVLDFSVHTSVGDYRLDVANINFLPLCIGVTKQHFEIAKRLVIKEHGEEILPYLDLYGFYYAFYFSNLYESDPTGYAWCLGILNDEERWERYF
jgi:hypothetical protein